MQKGVEPLAKRYCAKVARRLRGWVRNSTITEITLDCTDSICSNPELCDCDLPPAELWRKIIERFGQPHEYAMRFIDDQGKRAYTRYWFFARNLTILAIVTVLFSSFFSLYLRDVLWPSEYQITDPDERAAAIARLHEVFDQYRSLTNCRMQVLIENHVYGQNMSAQYQLFHRNTNTILRPIGVDIEHIGFTDSATTIYHPALRAYETFAGTEQMKTLFGNSLLIGLLQHGFSSAQLAVKENDVMVIMVNDTEVVYKISGVYFSWGDACFTIAIDRHKPTIRRFSVERPNTASEDESCLYSETAIETDFAGEVPEQTSVLKLPDDARYTQNMVSFLYQGETGWKAMSLVGRPAPPLVGIDVNTNRRVDITGYRGRPLLLVCCASWVPWHRLYLAALAEAYPLYRQHGVEVVVMAPDVEPRFTQEFLERTPMPFPYLTDYKGWSNPAFSRFELYAKYDYAPAFIAIDAGGKVVGVTARYFSPLDDSLPDLLEVFSPLLTENVKSRLAGQVRERFTRMAENDLMRQAETYFAVENDFYGKACLEEILRRQPDNVMARLRLCRLYVEYDWSQGNIVAEQCLNDTDASPFPYILIGNYYWQEKNDIERARREYAKARAVDSSCHLAWRQEGSLYYSQKQYNEAYLFLREALIMAPNDNKSLGIISKTLAELCRWEESVKFLRQALASAWNMRAAFDEHIPYNHRTLSLALSKLHDDRAAIAEIRIAMQYDHYRDDVLLSLSELLLRHGESVRDALVVTERLVEGNQIGKYHMLHGRALALTGRSREAVRAFRTAADLDPSLPELQTYLDAALAAGGDTSTR